MGPYFVSVCVSVETRNAFSTTNDGVTLQRTSHPLTRIVNRDDRLRASSRSDVRAGFTVSPFISKTCRFLEI